MAKQTFYFPHDGNARNDDRIIAVRMRHKMEGYGVYFAILERLLESSEYMSVKDYNVIAFDLHVGSALIKSIVEDFGLFSFTDDGKYFYSNSFNDRMKPLENIREQRRLAGKKSAEKRAKTNDSSTVVQRSLPKKATEESRVEDNKINNSSTSVLLSETSQPHAESIDYQKLIDFFNNETKGIFGNVRYPLSDKTKGMVRARIREVGKDDFAKAIRIACNSNFLKGQNDRNFKMTFQWMIRPTNFEKILSGNYDNRTSKTQGPITSNEDFTRSVAEGIARANYEGR